MAHLHGRDLACAVLTAALCGPCAACGGAESMGGDAGTDGTGDVSADMETDAGEDGIDAPSAPFPIVDTGQYECFAVDGATVACPDEGAALHGQDAQYQGAQPAYADNADGTVTDLVTGLMWQKDPGAKMTFDQASAGAGSFDLAGYDDWRLPTIKELYSLIQFTGYDPSGCDTLSACPGLIPFIDRAYFAFEYGDTSAGERVIDSQFASSNLYVDASSWDGQQMFGVNFADGRIKGYGTRPMPGMPDGKTFFVLYVRGPVGYGVNDLVDGADGTITDRATGLTWMRQDSGHLGAGDDADGRLSFEQALAFCEDLVLAGHDDWRLPDVKELQSIVDYTRSPGTTGSAAIDPLFECTPITNEGGAADFGFYWSSTTHVNFQLGGTAGAYVSFGRALGYMDGAWQDVHGAGAQRSDPKTGDPADFPTGFGPQGDAIRIFDFARCVRGATDKGDPVVPDPPVCGDDLCELPENATTCPEDCTSTGPLCGDDLCESPENETTCPEDCLTGPTGCTTDSDCDAPGACPPDASMGCTCEDTPMGDRQCVPNCAIDSDCPEPPGMTLVCAGGLCVPG